MSDINDRAARLVDAVKVVGEVIDKVPVYKDMVQPAAQELGKGLEVLAKAVNAALLPVEGFVWGVDKIRDFVRDRVAKKLEGVPTEDIQQPKPHIAVPAIDALRYMGSDSDLSELYANLLATSMDRATAYRAHPGFVDMIKNMTPDEARVMHYLSTNQAYPLIDIQRVSTEDSSFVVVHRHLSLLGIDAGCEHIPLASAYIDNLERLGLVRVETNVKMHDLAMYVRIEDNSQIKGIIENINKIEGMKAKVNHIRFTVTDLGKQFIQTCVIDKVDQPRT